MRLVLLLARVPRRALVVAAIMLVIASPARAAQAASWGDLVQPLMPLAGAVLTAVAGVLAAKLIAWLNLTREQAMAQAIAAGAQRAAGLAYQALLTQGAGLSQVEIRSGAVAAGVAYLADGFPRFVAALGLTPERLAAMVEAELGRLLAVDPTVTPSTASANPPRA